MAMIQAFRRNGVLVGQYGVEDFEMLSGKRHAWVLRSLSERQEAGIWKAPDKLADYRAPDIFIVDVEQTFP